MHEPLRGERVEVAAPEAGDAAAGRAPARRARPGRSASADRTAPRSGPSAPATQTHSAEALGTTVSGRAPAARPTRLGGLLEHARLDVGPVAPHDRRGVRAVERVAQPGRRALDADRRALEDERHDLEPLGVGAPRELVALALDLLGDAGERLVDEGEDRTGGDVEQLPQLVGVVGQLEGQRHPAPPRDVLPDAVAVQRVGVEPAPDEVAGDGEGLGPEVRRDPARRGRGGSPRPSGAGWRGCCGARRRPAPGRVAVGCSGSARIGRVDLGEDLLGRLEQQRDAGADELGDARARAAPRDPCGKPRRCAHRALRSWALRPRRTRARAGHPHRSPRPREAAVMTPEVLDLRPAPDHVDVLIVGAGISGIGAAWHLQDEQPGKTLRDPRGPRRDRRHLGPVPLPGHPLGLRPAHLRLRLQAVDRGEGDRRRRGDPRLHPRDRRGERHRPPHPLRPQGGPRRVVERPTRGGPSRSSAPTPARPSR